MLHHRYLQLSFAFRRHQPQPTGLHDLAVFALVGYAVWALRRLLRRTNMSLAEAWQRLRGRLG